MNFTYIDNPVNEIEIPKNGTLSRTMYSDDDLKVVLFAFDSGEELSEHTASMPALIQILKGEATIKLGDEIREAGAGVWIHMAAHLPHSIIAKTPLVMLLTLLKSQ